MCCLDGENGQIHIHCSIMFICLTVVYSLMSPLGSSSCSEVFIFLKFSRDPEDNLEES